MVVLHSAARSPVAVTPARIAVRALALLAVTLSLLVAPSTGLAQQSAPHPATLLDTMLRTGHADPAWFSETFLSQVSAPQVDAGIAGLAPVLGPYRSIAPTSSANRFVAQFAKGTDEILIYFDERGKIDGLLFRTPQLVAASLDDALKTLAAFPGTVSYVIEQFGGTAKAARQPDMPLAVGSAFKLAVLNALIDEIRDGRHHWSDAVPLQTQWKSLPSGVFQKWPTGTPITLATYATEMISVSDNTAADALIHIVGEKAIAPYAGNNEPFLTTREMFIFEIS